MEQRHLRSRFFAGDYLLACLLRVPFIQLLALMNKGLVSDSGASWRSPKTALILASSNTNSPAQLSNPCSDESPRAPTNQVSVQLFQLKSILQSPSPRKCPFSTATPFLFSLISALPILSTPTIQASSFPSASTTTTSPSTNSSP